MTDFKTEEFKEKKTNKQIKSKYTKGLHGLKFPGTACYEI